jgi:hypothetical protein
MRLTFCLLYAGDLADPDEERTLAEPCPPSIPAFGACGGFGGGTFVSGAGALLWIDRWGFGGACISHSGRGASVGSRETDRSAGSPIRSAVRVGVGLWRR